MLYKTKTETTLVQQRAGVYCWVAMAMMVAGEQLER